MPSKSIFHIIDILRRRIRIFLGNIFYVLAVWKGVDFAGRPIIIGRPKFRRYAGTKIVIGKRAEFLSGSRDNLIGINRPCMLSTFNAGTKINIGDDCGFSGTVIGAHVGITIGDRVKCGANTLITDSNWHPEDPRSGKPAPVVIGNDVWLGVNAVILKGVTIGDHAVIGANAVVTRDIPAHTVAAGNPCKVIRSLS